MINNAHHISMSDPISWDPGLRQEPQSKSNYVLQAHEMARHLAIYCLEEKHDL